MADTMPETVDPNTMAGDGVNLTSAREARKRAELDAQLLANRIALLKQEEEKAWKKIEETKKRAAEIVELRKQNEQKFSAKEQFYKQKWESIRSAQTQNAQQREKAKAVREQTRHGLMEQKHVNAQSTKQQSQHMLLQKKEREAAERQANLERSSYLKQRKDDAKRRMEEERMGKLEKYREDYEARTAQEEMLRARTDALVAKMEKEEMELIQRLQNTQTVQRNAYEELEAPLPPDLHPKRPREDPTGRRTRYLWSNRSKVSDVILWDFFHGTIVERGTNDDQDNEEAAEYQR